MPTHTIAFFIRDGSRYSLVLGLVARQFTLRARIFELLGAGSPLAAGLGGLLDSSSSGDPYIYRQKGMYCTFNALHCLSVLDQDTQNDFLRNYPDTMATLRGIDILVRGETELSQITGSPVFSDPLLHNARIDMESLSLRGVESLYRVVCEKWEKNIADLYQSFLTLRVRAIPPITAIVLSRCTNREQVLCKAIELRSELTSLRDLWTRSEAAIREASTLGEAFQEMRAFEEATERLAQAISNARPTERQILGTVWDILKESSSFKDMVVRVLDKAYKHDEQRRIRFWCQAFMDIYKKACGIATFEYPALCNKVFRESFHAELTNEFTNLISSSKGMFCALADANALKYNVDDFLYDDDFWAQRGPNV